MRNEKEILEAIESKQKLLDLNITLRKEYDGGLNDYGYRVYDEWIEKYQRDIKLLNWVLEKEN